MKPAPNRVFNYISPDTVAECWSGVTEKMYKVLWDLTVHIKPIPAEIMEDSGPADHIGHGNLADLWQHLTAEQATELNSIVERNR